MKSRTQAAIGSASILPSIAALRWLHRGASKYPRATALFRKPWPKHKIGHAWQPTEMNEIHTRLSE